VAKYFVDEALCQAHGQCFAVAPELFDADDEGYNSDAGKGWVEIPPELLEQAKLAESVCPETAIRVLDNA
jgi:ferredoxin